MVRTLLFFLIVFIATSSIAQEQESILFSEALNDHLPKYEEKAKDAYFYRNYERAEYLFDSLVNHGLNGSYMDDFKFYRLNSKPINLYDFKKPVYLITYAAWCVTTIGEIPALNQLAEEFSDKIDFVVLFWDNQKTTKKSAKDYNKHITVLYVDELENKDSFVVKQLKHSLGLPTTFLLDRNKKILDIRRGVNHFYGKSLEESVVVNYNSIYDAIATHLLSNRLQVGPLEPVALN